LLVGFAASSLRVSGMIVVSRAIHKGGTIPAYVPANGHNCDRRPAAEMSVGGPAGWSKVSCPSSRSVTQIAPTRRRVRAAGCGRVRPRVAPRQN
jgi:hypothetical protein